MCHPVVHIGLPKTGTTYLQLMLKRHRDRLLNDGWHVADTGSLESGATFLEATAEGLLAPGPRLCHHPIIWGIQGRADVRCVSRETLANEIAAECAVNPRFILTSECFYWEGRDVRHIQSLRDMLPSPPRVLCWLRNRFDFIERMYGQAVYDHAYKGSVEEFYSIHAQAFNFGEMLSLWAGVFGIRNLQCHLYEPGCDPFVRMLEAIGVDSRPYDVRRVTVNRSVPAVMIPVLRNIALPRPAALRVGIRLKQVADAMPQVRLLCDDMVHRIVDATKTGDENLRDMGLDVDLVSRPEDYLARPYIGDVLQPQLAEALSRYISLSEGGADVEPDRNERNRL
jgi:hypothetical protein